ncbi:MAG: T9SS type A sorting domain-containing protein, partial [Candidatus Stygibacter frigidus]|nr:T9SS type A sorting domain-containing protein [Candidatus Stygibacter frigidus]
FPNPFNPETTIEFILQQPSNVDLSIYNIKGQKVITLCDDFVNRVDEPVTFHWDGKDAKGNSTGSGVYFYLLQTQESSQIKKMVLIK